MKFLYEYQDKSNKRHSGTLTAPTRAAAYASLKAQGIKPIRCDEAPGLVNLVFGKGKRWLAIGVLGSLVVAAAFVIRSNNRTIEETQSVFDSPVRRQLLGDAAIIEKGIRTGWADVFDLEGDRFLASFAVPGVLPAIRTTTEEKLKESLAAPTGKCQMSDANSLEVRQVLAIVAGMKADIRALLGSGWSFREVGAALAQRQEQEIAYYERAKTEVETAAKAGVPKAELEQLLDQQNDALRKLGIRLVSMPE